MTDEQILQLVKEHFQEGGVRDDGSCSEYYGDPDAFVKFAEEIRKCGWDDGFEYATEIHTDEINLLREELEKLGKVL